MRKFAVILFLFFYAAASAIDVKIENPHLIVDAKNDAGDPVIAAHSKLHVSGIKGKKFDLVAIVKDDNGKWHTDANGNVVKTHYECTATYENTLWNDISVYIRHNKLAPKKGKHDYEVFLYVYYDGKWYGGTKAGSYTQTGNSSSSSRSQSSSSSSSSKSSSKTITCGVCNGSGIIVCLLCGGAGGRQNWRCLTYPPYSQYYEWTTCTACAGGGKVGCTWCSGKGTITINTTTNQNNYNNNYNNYNNYNNNYNQNSSSSSSGRSSAYSTCRICGGSGTCTSCHGKGGEWRSTGYYTGSDSKSWIDCGSCRGNKRCFNCHGTGRQ
ncbi:MAG: hypothetical protein K2G01_00470 [Paramuribaculum sp.]|nr:hypothetical protein [Paramuribaculum sp.]